VGALGLGRLAEPPKFAGLPLFIGGRVFDRTRIIKHQPGQIVNGFRIEGYEQADSKGLPVYRVTHVACGSQTTMHHRRPYALTCLHCQLQATRASLSQSEAHNAKIEAIRRHDEQVDAEYAAARRNPQAPAPAPPKPLRNLTQLERWELDGALRYGSDVYNEYLAKITKRIREEAV
jgi:hypothetical protein